MIFGFIVFIDFQVKFVLERQMTLVHDGSRDYGGGLGDHLVAG